jgi:thioredoxin reductase
LSIASQLRARDVDVRIFGPPMKFWRNMPRSINLKSFAFATSLYVPERGHTFPEWCRARGLEDFEPCSMASFASYGMWIQDRFVPDLTPLEVSRVAARGGGGFDLTLADGSGLCAKRVVFATGLSHFEHIPQQLSHLPRELVSHTCDLSDYSRFRGKEVVILGGGASAIEAGALVHEAGGRAQVLVREARVVIHGKLDPTRSLYQRVRYPNSVIGPGIKNVVMQKVPLAVHFLPESRRVQLVRKYLGPAAPWWIRDRFDGHVPTHVRAVVSHADPAGGRVRLRVREEGRLERILEVDHVIAGTGYSPDVDRLAYLDESLRAQLQCVERAPRLSMRFESSVKGAYFVGPVAAMSFGPIFRFVAGAEYAAPALARHLAGPVRTVTSAIWRREQRTTTEHAQPASSARAETNYADA